MLGGKVRFYNHARSLGSIVPDDGTEDVFVHAMALERAGVRDLTEGQQVIFEATRDALTGRLMASVLLVPLPCYGEAPSRPSPGASAHLSPEALPSPIEAEYNKARKPRVHRPEV
jgi:cold shock protein